MYGKLLILLLPVCWANLKLLSDEENVRISLTNCIVTACESQLKQTSNNILFMNLPLNEIDANKSIIFTLDNLLYKDLFKLQTFSVVINKANDMKHGNMGRKADTYLIQIREKDEIKSTMKYLQNQRNWNPLGKFVILTTTPFENMRSFASHLVKIMWTDFKVINVVFLLPRKNSTVFKVYSWSPYKKEGKCGREFGAVKVIDNCNFGEYENETKWFPNRIPTNLGKCEVKIRTIVWPPYVNAPVRKVPKTINEFEFNSGIEIHLINTIAVAANFTPIYTLSDKHEDWGILTMNGTATGMMASLLKEEVDIGISSIGSSLVRHIFFDSSISYLQDDLTICVPHSLPKPFWKKALTILSVGVVIICLICIQLIAIITINLARYESEEHSTYRNYISCILNILSILFYIPATLPRSFIIRFLIMFWIIVALHINILYQTNLISELSSTTFDQRLDTIDKLVKSDYNLYAIPTAKRFFRDDSEITRAIRKKLRDCDEMEYCLDRIAFQRVSSICTPRLYFNYISSKYVDSDGKPLIYCFRDNILTFSVEMLMRKGFVLKTRIDQLLKRIMYAGLIPFWMKKELGSKHTHDRKNLEENVVLTIGHLRFAFCIYGILIAVAFLVFVAEILIFKYGNKIKSIKCNFKY